MINIYSKTNTDFTKNGNATLIPIRADLSITLNGSWALEIEVPYDREGRWELIEEGAVIQVDVNCIRELSNIRQRFRIYDYKKGISSVTAIAFPVAMESTHDAPIDNLVISSKTGVQAMAQIQTKTNKYTLYSDITRTGSTSFANTNVNNAIASGSEGCFVDVWGGEIVYDNLKFSVLNRVGNNEQNKHKIIYGKDITDISYEKDDSGLVTRIYPISLDGIRLNGTGYVDSPRASQYPILHSRFMQAPYKLIEDDISSSTATAQLTNSIRTQITNLASSLSHSVYNTAISQKVEIEYIKKIRTDIITSVQNMATANIYQADANKVMMSAISNGMQWLKDVSKPEWTWHGSDATGWWYGSSTSDRATSEWLYVDRIWRYFGDNSLWQRPRDDDSKKWGWLQESNGKKYGNRDRYYAQKTTVYTTVNGQMKEYYFDDDGIWDESDDTDSNYAWHGSGTSADPYWFGDDSTTGKFLKDGWWFIDGYMYYFDSEGYYDNTTRKPPVSDTEHHFEWDWVETSDGKYWFGNEFSKNYDEIYVTNQWLKADGDWYRFDSNGYAIGDTALENEVVARFTTGMAQLKTLCESLYTQAYNLLYSQMTSYCTKVFNTGVDIPSVKITVNMADLSNTTEYEQYRNLEKVYLGDSVTALDYKHGISAVERIVSIKYDCIRKVNSEVEIGVASSSLSDILKTEAGGSIAGGFDTSIIEGTLTSHTNELARLESAKQDKLTAGDGISISNNIISATRTGGGNVYYGSGVPSSSLGSNRDLYLRTAESERVVQDYSEVEGGMVSYEVTALADNVFDFAQVIKGNNDWDHITYPLYGLVEGKQYTVSFDFKFTNASFYNNYTNYIGIDEVSGARIELPTDNNSHSYSFTFTASASNNLTFSYPKLVDNITTNSDITNFTISGEFGWSYFSELYGKIEGEWRIYKGEGGGTAQVQADWSQSDASAVDYIKNKPTIPSDINDLGDVDISSLANGDILKYNSTSQKWENGAESGGTTVVANPSGTATANLSKLQVGSDIYSVSGGGGGNIYGSTTLDWARLETVATSLTTSYIYYTPSSNGILFVEGYGSSGDASVVINTESVPMDLVIMCRNDSWTTNTIPLNKGQQIGLKKGSVNLGGLQIYFVPYKYSGEFTPVIYSTEEREIGVWHDGKPLYRKMFDFTSSPISLGSSWVTTPISSSDIDKVVTVRAFHSDGTVYEEIDADPTRSNHTWVGVKGVGTAYYLMLEYTKLSDVAGSGSYNTLGVPTVHYTTDEQVIGTWIDGKPLYRRTWNFTTPVTVNSNSWADTDIAVASEHINMIIGCDAVSDAGAKWNFISATTDLATTTYVRLLNTRNTGVYVKYLTLEYTKTTD